MDCGLPGSSVHGIFQAKGLEWGAIAFSDCYPLDVQISRPELFFFLKASLPQPHATSPGEAQKTVPSRLWAFHGLSIRHFVFVSLRHIEPHETLHTAIWCRLGPNIHLVTRIALSRVGKSFRELVYLCYCPLLLIFTFLSMPLWFVLFFSPSPPTSVSSVCCFQFGFGFASSLKFFNITCVHLPSTPLPVF